MNAAAESRSATSRGHRNAPLTPESRLRLRLRIDAGRPVPHVAAEAGISRRCLAKWYARRRAHGENGLLDHSSRSATSPRPHPRGHGTLSLGPPAGPPGETTESSSASRPNHARTSRSSSPSRTSR
ncbi:helix-turn-helix domain-containing protein [Streptomyces cinerochromogenes]|uniref:Helix-turn-helix domain-containing protein n=1 Tax=Streptomyces cinerochromogenes TaxID=66422 RepID=A0ABW7B9H8_9ACTN